jgi:hypothetical protein
LSLLCARIIWKRLSEHFKVIAGEVIIAHAAMGLGEIVLCVYRAFCSSCQADHFL